jgi:hypothetical protein
VKVKIVVGCGRYAEGVKGGKRFTSVDFSGRNYGGGCPCDSEEDVCMAIKHAKKWITDEGDSFVVEDFRFRQESLSSYF